MGRTVQFALAIQLTTVCLAAQPIGILFDFASRPDVEMLNSMKAEIRQIMAPADLELTFQPLAESEPRTFRKIVVVRFRGVCAGKKHRVDMDSADASVVDFPALGRTDISGGHVLPFVQVYCDEVRQLVPFTSSSAVARIFGRALGRVVAHELYHALLATRDHSRTGVARFAQSPSDLTRERLSLDPVSIHRLRSLYPPTGKGDDSEESSPTSAFYYPE